MSQTVGPYLVWTHTWICLLRWCQMTNKKLVWRTKNSVCEQNSKNMSCHTWNKNKNKKYVYQFRACSKFMYMFTKHRMSYPINGLGLLSCGEYKCHGGKVFFFDSRVQAWNISYLKTSHNRLNPSLYLKWRLHQSPLHYLCIPSVLCIKLSQPVW